MRQFGEGDAQRALDGVGIRRMAVAPEIRELYARVFDHIGDAVIVTDLAGAIVDWNSGAQRLFGYARGEVLGRDPSFLFAPEDGVRIRDAVLATLHSGGSWRQEVVFRRKDGSEVWCESHVVSVLDERGLPYLTVGVNRDISRRKDAEGEVRLAAEILDHIREAVHLIRCDDLSIVHVNARFERLFGYSADEIRGQHVRTLNAAGDTDPGKVAETIANELRAHGAWEGEVLNVRRDGTEFWSRARVTEFEHPTFGRVWLSVHDEISELKEVERQRAVLEETLQRTQKLESLGTLAGGVAHDFNNVLQGIMLSAEGLLDQLSQSDPAVEDAEAIASLVERGQALVQRILTFARSAPATRERLDLRHVVTQTLALVRPLLPTTISVRMRLPRVPAWIVGDPTQLQQMLVNLCTNAAFAMRKTGGELAIEAELVRLESVPDGVDEWVHLSVEDTGEGIPEELQSRVFDPFFTTKDAGDGTGLGLAIVHSTIETHGGTVSFESARGFGTRFDIRLPRSKEVPAGEPAIARRRCIAVVDDEDISLAAYRRILERRGFDVVTFDSAERAIPAILQELHRFDAVVTDLAMPGKDGLALSKALHAASANLPVALMTGHSVPTPETLARSGVRVCLSKPFRAAELVEALQQMLDGREEAPTQRAG